MPHPLAPRQPVQRMNSDPRFSRSQSVSKALPPTRTVTFERRSTSTVRAGGYHRTASLDDAVRSRNSAAAAAAADRQQQHEDPEQVARAVLNLMERRDPPRRENPRSVSRGSRGSAGSKDSQQENRQYMQASSGGVHSRSASTPKPRQATKKTVHNHLSPRSSPEEQRATKNICQAEDKINVLLQELEDLKFLEEIDMQDAPRNTMASRSQSVPRPRVNESYLKTPRGDHIPPVIRAMSPSKERGLPPPPAPHNDDTLPSPRQISRMDRMALELETQKLVLKVDVLQKEKATLEKAVEMYEISLQDHERSGATVAQLEGDLAIVRKQLATAKQDLVTVREQICADYEDRLNANLLKLQRIQKQADANEQERNSLRRELEKVRQEFKASRQKWNQEASKDRSNRQAKEAVLAQQLQEVTDLADDLQTQLEQEQAVVRQLTEKLQEQINARDSDVRKLKEELREQRIANDQERHMKDDLRNKLAKKDEELEQLQKDLQHSDRVLEETKASKDEAYEVRLSSLQEQLALQKDKHKKAANSNEELATEVLEQAKQLSAYKKQCDEQSTLISELTERLDEMHADYRLKFDELKETYEAKEKRRLQEMVEAQSSEVAEYERRLKALQEQLAHQNNRHHAEIKQKEEEMEKRLNAQKTNLKREIEIEHGQQLHVIEEKLTIARQDYEEADNERRRLRAELESMPSKEDTLKAAKEQEYREAVRDNENNRLREKAERLIRELESRDEKLEEMAYRLSEAEKNNAAKLARVRAQHADLMMKRDEETSEQMKAMRSTEVKLHNELERREADLNELKTSMEARVAKLQSELDQTFDNLGRTREIANQQAATQEQLDELRSAYDLIKRDLEAEQQRNENSESQMRVDIAVLEGKLRASESTLKRKREAVDDLKEKLSILTEETTQQAEEHQREMQQLRDELKLSQEALDREQAALEAKKTQLQGFQEEHDNLLKEKEIRVNELEASLSKASKKGESLRKHMKELESACKEAKAELITERTRHESAEEQTRVDMAVQVGKLRACEASLKHKREQIEDLEEKLRNIADESSSTNKELQKELDCLRDEVKALNTSRDKDRAQLFTKTDLLEQHQRRLRDNAELIKSLEDTVLKKDQALENSEKKSAELIDALKEAKVNIVSEQARNEKAENELRQQISALENKLHDREASLKEHSEKAKILEKKLRVATDESTASVGELRKQNEHLLNEVQTFRNILDSEKADLLSKEQQIGKLREEKCLLEQRCQHIQSLEESLVEATQKENALTEQIDKLQTAIQHAESERTRHESLQAQLRSDVATLEEKLQVSESTLRSKLDVVKHLEKKLQLTQDDLSSCSKELRNEVVKLRLDLERSNELLKKERRELLAKNEQYDELAKEVGFQKEKVRNLQEALARVEDEKVDQSFELTKLQNECTELERSYSVVEDLESRLAHEETAKAALANKLADIEAVLDIKERQLSHLPALQSQLKELVEGREELQAQLGRVEAELERKDKQLSVASDRLSESTAQFKEELAEIQKEKELLESQLHSVEAELEMKGDSMKNLVPELRAQLSEQAKLNDELRMKLKLSEAERSNMLTNFTGEFSVELQNKVEQLTRTKASLETKIRELEEDREDREKQVKESLEKSSNQILELQMKVEELSKAKLSLKSRLSRAESGLEQKDDLISVASTQFSEDMSDLQSRLSERLTENEVLKSKLEFVESKLLTKEIHLQGAIDEKSKELRAKLDAEAKEKRSLRLKIGDIEAELQRKEKQIKDIVDRYTKDISDLEDKLEDQLKSNAALQKDVDKLKRTTSGISEPSSEASELRLRLAATEKSLQVEKTALNDAKKAREKLENALAEQQNANADLQRQIEQLKRDADNKSDELVVELECTNSAFQQELDAVKADAEKAKAQLEEKLANAVEARNRLEDEVRSLKNNNGDSSDNHIDLEQKLSEIEKSKSELEERLKKVNAERTEVITALEEVINEVQNREEEIASLANILRKRDEELDHAKLIATKALASAQEIKSRYKGKNGERHSELTEKIAELNSNVDFLSKKNESLERKTSRMERELQEREIECIDLRKKLNKQDAKVQDGFHSLDGFPTFDTASPTQASQFGPSDTMSTQSADVNCASGWLHDFDSQSTDSSDTASFTGIRTEPSESSSRRSIERDALRKYVRKRYMKSRGNQ